MTKELGKVIILSAPGGAGKNTILKELLKKDFKFISAVSTTTRSPRKGEIDGVDYFFKTKEEFLKMIKDDEFLEYEEFTENFYGTSKSFLYDNVEEGKIIIYQIDFRGADSIRKKSNLDVLTIFIMPPSLGVLRERLIKRGDDLDYIEKRLKIAKEEMKHKNEYDHLVVNDDLETAIQEVYDLIKS